MAKFKKLLLIMLIAAVVLAATGCGKFNSWFSEVTGGPGEECIDGVKYLHFSSGVTVKYTEEGGIASCPDMKIILEKAKKINEWSKEGN